MADLEPSAKPACLVPIAEAYRRLVISFELARDYESAEDCYVGAMEMTRRDPAQGKIVRVVLYCYQLASHYGSSYTRALGMTVVLMVLFGLAMSVTGVSAEGVQTEASLDGLKGLGAAIYHSLEVATFQRRVSYVEISQAGRFVALLESVLVPSQFALFLLALRRRFRR